MRKEWKGSQWTATNSPHDTLDAVKPRVDVPLPHKLRVRVLEVEEHQASEHGIGYEEQHAEEVH